MAQTEKSEQELGLALDLNQATTDAIAACGGDLLATVRSLVVENGYLLEENAGLTERNGKLVRELDWVWKLVSPGYTRSTNKRRMSTGGPEE